MKNTFFKYPKVPYNGNIIKGYAEIEKNVFPYCIDFIVTFSMYLSGKAQLCFDTSAEESPSTTRPIDTFHDYVEDNFLDVRKITRRIRDLLPSEGYGIHPYTGFLFAFDHKGIRTMREFKRIYNPVTVDIKIDVTREKHQKLVCVEDLSEFICEMLEKFDRMFYDIQCETEHKLIFIPRNLAKTEKEKRVELLENRTWEMA